MGRLSWLAGLLLLCSCATGIERFGRPLLADRIGQITPGQSSRAEVLALLGPPVRDPHAKKNGDLDEPERESIERALYWEYSERRETFATAILYTFFSQETLTDSLMIVFDEHDVAQIVSFERETKP